MINLNGKVAVITGAATGIGFALARQFVNRGARIVIAARRRERLDQAASILRADGSDVRVCECDVSDRSAVERLADFAWREFGQVDVIVNNAGIGPSMASVIDADESDVRRVFDVNFFGVWNGVSVFGKRLIAQGTLAAIYNVGSENCFFNAVPRAAEYIASKHALLAMTYALREEVPEHIEVGLICPGLVKSEFSDETDKGMDADAFAVIAIEQILAGEFIVVSHAHNIVRVRQRFDEVEAAFTKYVPRYPGDEEFDVRTLAKKHKWW